MQPFETLDQETTPEGRRLSLHRRGEHFYIHLDSEELMSSHHPDSEKALAELGCQDLPKRNNPKILIGGLGFGFTLRSALALLPPTAEVVVAELFPVVLRWNREFLGAPYREALEDPRTRVELVDVGTLMAAGETYDAILLDVDNGPNAFCLAANGRLYDRAGLGRIRQTLNPGGQLAIWSAHADPAFVKRLDKSGFQARTETVRAFAGKGSKHTLFLGRRPKKGESKRRPRRKKISRN
jgi:spermidine synthase